MTHYKDDPRWIKARFNSACPCGNIIRKCEDAFYYPRTKTALCKKCGDAAELDFNLAVQDEDFYNSQIHYHK